MSLRCPSSWIQYLSPLFELDPLFRRTFLLVVPVKEFGRIPSSGPFTPAEIYTTLAKGLLEKGRILQNCPEVTLLGILTLNLARLVYSVKRFDYDVKFEFITLHWRPVYQIIMARDFVTVLLNDGNFSTNFSVNILSWIQAGRCR